MNSLHPEHAGKGQRQREHHHPPPRMKTHPVRAERAADFVLLERPITQPRRQQPPKAEENRRSNVKSGHREHRPFRAQRTVAVRVHRHPRINVFCKKRDRQEQERQPREKQRRDVFANPARGHRPAGVAQMMDHHQKQRAEGDAQEKHERQQPRKSEFRRIHPAPITDNTAPTAIKTAGSLRHPDKSSGGGKGVVSLGELMVVF